MQIVCIVDLIGYYYTQLTDEDCASIGGRHKILIIFFAISALFDDFDSTSLSIRLV
jgi:hypothetical protein